MADLLAAMEQRHSVRRYSPEDIPEDSVALLRMAAEAAEPLDSRVEATVQLVPFEALDSRSAVGALGLMNQAPWYLVARAKPQPGRMEELGFRMEQAILAATTQGLGTCWLGGFFRPGLLAERLGCEAEDIVAISPVGYPEQGRRQDWTQALVHGVSSRQGQRKALQEFAFWQHWEEPVERDQIAPEIWRALEMARLAPSWSNVQPWYFLMTENLVLALGDSRPRRGNSRPHRPYYRLDVGIAMCHFWLTLQELAFRSHWSSLRREESLAHGALDIPEAIVPIGTLVP